MLNIVSTETNLVIGTISGFFGPFGISLTKDGRYAYVSNFGSNDFAPFGTFVSIVDLKYRQIIRNIEVGIQPSGIIVGEKFAYVSTYNALYKGPGFTNLTYGEGSVSTIRLDDMKLIAPTIPVGQTPSTLVLSPNEGKLYLTNYSQNTVRSISL